ncbi:MAG: hypothetical protein PHN90_09190 [Methanothrix sp.]|jgi:hypothetical protein|nr:hypothetical protein [Candidatus Omnitrophota bacterium]MDD3565828.1 hypothetical protein [Methanothrix sp.]
MVEVVRLVSSRKGIVIKNKRKQRAVVAEHNKNVRDHKRKIRMETMPQMKKTKQEWYLNSRGNLLDIRRKWAAQRIKVRAHMKAQNRLHREKINAHKIKVKIMMNQ